MALRGLEITTWVGWLLGLIILRTPWGIPSLPSWFTFSSLYSLSFLCFDIFVLVDMIHNSSSSWNLVETNALSKLVTRMGVLQHVVIFFYYRLILILNSKKLANFMARLHFYQLPSTRPCKFWENMMLRESILNGLINILTFTALFVGSLQTGPLFDLQTKRTWLGVLIGNKWIYGGIFFFVDVGIHFMMENIVYMLVVCFLVRLGRIIDHFAEETVATLRKSMKYEEKAVKLKIATGGGGGELRLEELRSVHQLTLEKVYTQFREMENLCRCGSEITSPLILGMVFIATSTFIVCVSKAIVLRNRPVESFIVDILRVAHSWVVLGVVEFGHVVNQSVERGKTRIFHEVIRMPADSLLRMELETSGVVNRIRGWRWSVNASGFFVIGRKLTKGIINIILSYVVIFFQTYTALYTPAPKSCSNTTVTVN